MRPPTEAVDEIAPQPSENPAPGEHPTSYMTQDKEVADWVHKQLELHKNGGLPLTEKPALHAVALDKVAATSPIRDDARTPSTKD